MAAAFDHDTRNGSVRLLRFFTVQMLLWAFVLIARPGGRQRSTGEPQGGAADGFGPSAEDLERGVFSVYYLTG